MGSKPHLVGAFAGPSGDPHERYLAAVRSRFGEWIIELCSPPDDQAWLDDQHEIAPRHHFETLIGSTLIKPRRCPRASPVQ